MLFKDTKQGYPVYLLDRENVKAYQGKVVSVSVPRLQQPPIGTMPQLGIASQMVVDVTIEADGTTRTYSIPEASGITYAGATVLSTDRDGIIREIEAIKSQSEEALRNIDKHKGTVIACDRILEDWNPTFAEKKAQEARISSIENEVKGLGVMLKDFISEFRK